jgi:hypothetical protein
MPFQGRQQALQFARNVLRLTHQLFVRVLGDFHKILSPLYLRNFRQVKSNSFLDRNRVADRRPQELNVLFF